jgi:predicted CxxxxCH...CXXCH cytochrome family protein
MTGGATPAMSTAHAKHVNAKTAGYAYGCQLCHVQTTANGTAIVSGSTRHVDGVRSDVFFDTSSALTPAGSYVSASHTCQNTRCHGNMKGGLVAAPTWNGTAPCGSCHLIPPVGGTDTQHKSTDTDCGQCHPNYTSTAVYVPTHCDGNLDVQGGCLGCHQTGAQNDGTVPGARRAVGADFTKNSHHVYSAGATGGNLLTDNDCAVCHAEANVASKGGSVGTSALHKNGMIDLRDADNTANSFQYNKRQVCIDTCVAAGGTTTTCTTNCDTSPTATTPVPWGAAALPKWGSVNATWKTEMSGQSTDGVLASAVSCGTNCSKGLDRFCISCHDADGASASAGASGVSETCASATNPFCDLTVTNTTDQQNRTRVVDIASRVSVAARTAAGGYLTPASRDPAGAARVADTTIHDPPEGVWSRHAIRGLAVSVYKTNTSSWDAATYWNDTQVVWRSMSVMDCADCHSVDGANGANGNAHGSGGEYLLKDATGAATEPALKAYASYICARCHSGTWYAGSSHTANGGDWQDFSTSTGTARAAVGGTGGNIFGYACGNCHGGGAPSKAGATLPTGSTGAGGWGTIHGTSQVIGFGVDGGAANTAYRQAYRFVNGNSMRYYDPVDWVVGTRTCYTLNTADSWGGCTKHGGGVAKTQPAPAIRQLNY